MIEQHETRYTARSSRKACGGCQWAAAALGADVIVERTGTAGVAISPLTDRQFGTTFDFSKSLHGGLAAFTIAHAAAKACGETLSAKPQKKPSPENTQEIIGRKHTQEVIGRKAPQKFVGPDMLA